MKKILMLFIISLFLINLVSASMTVSSAQTIDTSSNTANANNRSGWKVIPNYNITILGLKYGNLSGTAPNVAYITDASKNVLQSATMVNNDSTFSMTLNEGTTYYWFFTNTLSSWRASRSSATSTFPYHFNAFNVTAVVDNSEADSTGAQSWWVISSVTYENVTNLTYENIYTSSIFEMTRESFSANTTNSTASVTSAKLSWGGLLYDAQVTNFSNNVYTLNKTIDIPLGIGNKPFFWVINYNDSSQVNSSIISQQVNATNFTLCGSSPLDLPFINFTFKNETIGQESISSSISSSFVYWISNQTINKTLTYTNTPTNASYAFCSSAKPNQLKVNPVVSYYNPNAVQRTYSPESLTLTNTTTNTILWLLPTSDGIYVSFQVVNTPQQPIQGVLIKISRSGIGDIESKTTDASGLATFFLNPNNAYTINATKTGYTEFDTTITPTQTSYTIDLGGGTISSAFNFQDLSKGVTFFTAPNLDYLNNGTTYTFNFTISSTYWDLDGFGFTLKDNLGNVLGSDSDIGNSGTSTLNLNVARNTSINMNYYWIIDGNYSNGTRMWIVFDNSETSHSINNFLTRFKHYWNDSDTHLFGLTNTSMNLIIFIIIALSGGLFAFKFGIDNPMLILGLLFLITAFFDYMGLITYFNGMPNKTASILMFILFLGSLIREMSQ